MSKDFGIYPQDKTPKLWWGCRAIINKGYIDIPYDRKSFEGNPHDTDAEDFFFWINNTAIPKLEEKIKQRDTKNIYFKSESEMFICEASDRQSGGYLYIGCYTSD